MDFFEQQHEARRMTQRMIWMFAAAVICVVVALDILIAVVYAWVQYQRVQLTLPHPMEASFIGMGFFRNLAEVPSWLLLEQGELSAV